MRNHKHHDALLAKHRRLEEMLAEELARPLPDRFVLMRLKRQKLLVKDEIESWERVMHIVHADAPRRTIPPTPGEQEPWMIAVGR